MLSTIALTQRVSRPAPTRILQLQFPRFVLAQSYHTTTSVDELETTKGPPKRAKRRARKAKEGSPQRALLKTKEQSGTDNIKHQRAIAASLETQLDQTITLFERLRTSLNVPVKKKKQASRRERRTKPAGSRSLDLGRSPTAATNTNSSPNLSTSEHKTIHAPEPPSFQPFLHAEHLLSSLKEVLTSLIRDKPARAAPDSNSSKPSEPEAIKNSLPSQDREKSVSGTKEQSTSSGRSKRGADEEATPKQLTYFADDSTPGSAAASTEGLPAVVIEAGPLTSRVSSGISRSPSPEAGFEVGRRSLRITRRARGRVVDTHLVGGRVQGRLPGHERIRRSILTRRSSQTVIFPSQEAWLLRTNRFRGEVAPIKNKMKSYVQFLTTPTADTPGTVLLLHFDSKRYLIGHVAEGTQRACIQRRTTLTKVEDIFMTGKIDWSTTGGLLGMILTLADSKSTAVVAASESKKDEEAGTVQVQALPRLRIHGGSNLTHLLATARRFIFRKGMPLDVDEIREEAPRTLIEGSLPPTFVDENIQCWSMANLPTQSAVNSRKRSHDEMTDADIVEQQHMDQIRQAVVGSMFDSTWQLDHLVSMSLKDVKLPAKIYIRRDGITQEYTGPLPGGEEPVPDVEVMVREPWPASRVDDLAPTKPSQFSMSYVIKNHPQRGKFDPVAAKRLRVKKGLDFAKLTMGKSVVSEDGQTVTPDMVLGAGKLGGGFAILDIPDRTYIDTTLARQELASSSVMGGVEVIIWVLGKDVYGDERLTEYMAKTKLKHIVSSPDVCSNQIALESPASAAIRLNMIDRERFPIPRHNNIAKVPISVDEGYLQARVGKKIDLEPILKIVDELGSATLDTAKVVEEMPEEVLQLAKWAQEEVASESYVERLAELQSDLLCKDAEVITLGTGSALPSKYRNVSATLLRIPEYGNYLFDCGENTLGQLKRVFGDELPRILKDLKVLYISHLHADHHLGTASVIKAWHEATSADPDYSSRRLMVVSAQGMISWLYEYSSVEDFGYERLHNLTIHVGKGSPYQRTISPEQQEAFGIARIDAVRVDHCHDALGVALTFPNGFKVAYSGDCRPSKDFAQIGKGATLLIHEATFDDELSGDARAKKHSTTSEALAIGREMEARRILLTHFSQRYQKIPVMGNTTGKDQVAIVAFDYMRCKLGDFAKLAQFRPALLKLYEDKQDK